MKKLIAMLLAMVMVLGLVACAAKTEPPAADTKTETPAAETPAAETPAEETPAEETPAAEGAVKTDVIATEGKAAELGIPAAVVLQDTTALEGKKIGCSICYKGDEWCAALAQALEALGAYYGADIVCEDGVLDLDSVAQDDILLELPIRMLCSEDCKGLCPVCGCNLNKEQCSCQQPEWEGRRIKAFDNLEWPQED